MQPSPQEQALHLGQLGQPAATQKRRPSWLAPAIAVVATLAVVAGGYVLWQVLFSGSFDAEGTVALKSNTSITAAALSKECEGTGGFSDLREGAQVTVTDAAGSVVAIGALQAGASPLVGTCVFPFTIKDVPGGSGFYGVQVGGEQRGTVRFTEDQMRSGAVEIGVGN